jgi:hypothetical protein
MDQSITINSKVFSKTKSPTPTSTVFTTRSRGVTLPDSLQVAHREQKNPIEAGSIDKLSSVSFQRTYINADGVPKTGQMAHTSRIPDDMPEADITALRADLTDWLASAITLRTTNVAAMDNGEVA